MNISVIIPVFNQEKIISETLNSLISQDIKKNKYEIIVVDDGSVDKTWSVLESFKKKTGENFFILKTIGRHGKGVARNLGIQKAKNKLIVLLDSDIIAPKNLLLEHLKWHQKFPNKNFAMVGYITWFPKLKITPFMYWLEHGGGQLDFDELIDNSEIDYRHFYTGNVSFKKDFLLKNKIFDEDFGRRMYEDLELAYRLQKNGLRVFYNRNAQAYHYHKTDIKKYSKRMINVGEGARILFEKHPELKDKIAPSKLTFRTIINQIFSPMYFLIGKICKSIRWTGYYYNAKFFRIYMKGYSKK